MLPTDVSQALAAVGQRLENSLSVEAELPAAVAGIAALPPAILSRADRAISTAARLYERRPPSLAERLSRRRVSDAEQLRKLPDLSCLFLFHNIGQIREEALRRIEGGLPSPFLFAAVVLRLNDWAPPVRSAAFECARRCFPMTPPEVIAEAAMDLLLRQDSWQRWDREREVVDMAFARPDVGAKLADLILNAQTGPASRVLRAALKQDSLDPHLERMAGQAKQPSVRALAVRTIAEMKASWHAGTEYKWIDKSMGERVQVPILASRALTPRLPRQAVVAAATLDRSALVRRAALDALILHPVTSDQMRELAGRLARDTSRSVRERAAFILSRHPEMPLSAGPM
ncbi:hypothetical protein [Amaricoccus sp.]|uniref:hypothetical protein n=1 Tax=Amaricoccus sp. TaxID=1872485 RepID=UPI0033149BC3